MGGVYGEFLGFYSELFEDFEIYKNSPDIASGYDLVFEKRIRAVKQSVDEYINLNKYKSIATLDVGNKYYFWSYEKLRVADEFVKIDGNMYRPMKEAIFNREGGFYETVIEMVVGNDGTKDYTPELDEGTFG